MISLALGLSLVVALGRLGESINQLMAYVPTPPKPPPGVTWGRPKGSKNKSTNEQREFARRIIFGPEEDPTEQWLYFNSLRKRLLAGVLAPQLEALVLYYLFGKPVERIQVKDTTPALDGVTDEEIRQRALAVASFVAERTNEGPNETPEEPEPEPEPKPDYTPRWPDSPDVH